MPNVAIDTPMFAAGGNPYGVCVATGQNGDPPSAVAVAHAEYVGERVTELASQISTI